MCFYGFWNHIKAEKTHFVAPKREGDFGLYLVFRTVDIVETTRAFGKTMHSYREFRFLLLNKYTIQIGQGTKKLLSVDIKTWVQEAHAMVKSTGQLNYKQTCLTVSSCLCKDKLLIHLQHYDLKIVCEYLQFC